MLMTAEMAETTMQARYVEAGGVGVIPWAIILPLILELFANCKPKTAQRFAKNHPIACEAMIENKLKDETSLAPKKRQLVAAVSRAEFVVTSVANIESLWECCGA